MNNVTIVGAGPAGLQTAIKLRENGFDSVVLEEHERVGTPEHCTGLISKTGVDELGISLDNCLQNTIYGAKIYSPNGTMLKVTTKKPVAYVVDRKELDQSLMRKARLMGVHVATHTKLIDAKKSITGKETTLFVQVEGRGEMRRTQYLVGADGVNSTLRHIMKITPKKENFVHTIQGTAKGEFDEKFVEVYLGDHSKGFFAWVVPIDKEHAKVGLGSVLGENVLEGFNSFLKEKLPNAHIRDKVSALVPYGDPLRGIVKENLALVGDAAFQTKATTGGGIIFGMKAGNVLGETLSNTLKGKGKLTDYEKNLSKINEELKLHYKIRRYANTLSNKQIDDLFVKLKQKGFEEFLSEHGHMDEPSKFVGKLMTNPKYWSLAPSALKFFRT